MSAVRKTLNDLRSSSSLSLNAAWAQPIAVLALAGVVCLLYAPSVQSLWVEWLNLDKRVYSHGPLIAALSAWLLVRANKGESRPLVSGSNLRALALGALIATSLAWLVVYRAGIQIGHQALLPILILLAVWGAYGAPVAKRSCTPILLLYAAIPIWDEAIGILQQATVLVVGTALRALGVPVYVSGNLVEIPSGVFEVEDGCAGLHFFVVAITIAALLGEIQRDSGAIRIRLLMIAAGLAVLANWVRVFVVVLAGHLTDMQHFLVRVDHYYFGWVVFALAMTVFFLVARRFPAHQPDRQEQRLPIGVESSRRHTVSWALVSLVAIGLGPSIGVLIPVASAAKPNVLLPEHVDGWSKLDTCSFAWHPAYVGADSTSMQSYAAPAGEVCAFTVTYLSQRQGKELTGFPNSLAGSEARHTRTRTAEGAFNEVRWANEDGDTIVAWYTHAIGERATSSSVAAQLIYGTRTLVSSPASSIVAVAARCTSDCGEERDRLHRLLQDMRVAGAELPK